MEQKPVRITVIIIITLCLISINSASETSQRSLLLISDKNFNISSLSHTEVRKLFLGVPVIRGEVRIKPVLNTSDPLITEVFLQKVIFMSRRDYDRQVLSRVFRSGGHRPAEYENIQELVKELQNLPGSVSYMWSDQLEEHPELKSLGTLW